VIRPAVKKDGKIFHPLCFEDAIVSTYTNSVTYCDIWAVLLSEVPMRVLHGGETNGGAKMTLVARELEGDEVRCCSAVILACWPTEGNKNNRKGARFRTSSPCHETLHWASFFSTSLTACFVTPFRDLAFISFR
jgi:hypothetical protein